MASETHLSIQVDNRCFIWPQTNSDLVVVDVIVEFLLQWLRLSKAKFGYFTVNCSQQVDNQACKPMKRVNEKANK